MIQNTLFVPQCTLFVNQITQNTIFYNLNVDGLKNQNMILDQLNMGEHLAKCKAQVTKQNIILQKEW